jgi:hypothetical protein
VNRGTKTQIVGARSQEPRYVECYWYVAIRRLPACVDRRAALVTPKRCAWAVRFLAPEPLTPTALSQVFAAADRPPEDACGAGYTE